ncbi:MAG: branched-chain amino acid ABC transporter permease [Actinobacteria bacterium]|nr:branched-chain amino acid ABC transporter permease [Actinomycetota bacterium]
MEEVVRLGISAVLLAGLYSVMAYGLGLIYGVLRIVNLAHAGVIMAAAYVTWLLHSRLGIDPYLAIPVILVVFFIFGVLLYKGVVRFLPRGAAGGVQSLLLLFGIWLVMRNGAYLLFSGNDRAIRTEYSTHSISIFGTSVAQSRVVVFVIAVLTLAALHLFLTRTYTGKAIRAVAQNPDSGTIVGVNVERFYALTFGIGTSLGGLAGLLLATIFAFNPTSGAVELLKSFVVVVLGGLGSVVGIALGALVLAFAESYAILILPSYLTAAVSFVLLVVVLVLRPGGLFGQRVLA